MDLTAYNWLWAVSLNAEANAMVCARYRPKSTPLTEEYDFEAYNTDQDEQAVKLFALDEKGRLRVFSADHDLKPGPGWTVVSLALGD